MERFHRLDGKHYEVVDSGEYFQLGLVVNDDFEYVLDTKFPNEELAKEVADLLSDAFSYGYNEGMQVAIKRMSLKG